MTIPCPIAQHAHAQPERVALRFEGQSFTWKSLATRVDAWERALAALPAGSRVGVLHGNHPELVAVHGASVRTHVVLVLLNPRLSDVELDALATQARLVALVVDEANAARLSGLPRLVPSPVDEPTHSHPTQPSINLDRVAYVLFTSGTTGVPKGACISVGNLVASAQASALVLGTGPEVVWLGTLPLFHIGGLAMVWRWFMQGCVLSLHARFDAARTLETLASEHITHASLVPTTLQRVLDAGHIPPLPSLRAVLIGGGPSTSALLQRANSAGIPALWTYGLTETCSQTATARPGQPVDASGPALPGVEVRVVDSQRNPVPAQQDGEIEVRGPTVMHGYLDQADATQDTLGTDGWLRTRDLGFLDAQENLHVLARRSDLILSGGENIYPAQVEAVLLAHPLVEDVVVVARDDALWGQVPKAFVVTRGPVEQEMLEAHCRTLLAAYKVPKLWQFLDVLPRNAMGKVERRTLP